MSNFSHLEYIHGYTQEEQDRLNDQALVLGGMIYEDLDFTGVNNLLEIGCGTGAQTRILLQKNREMRIESCDISEIQLEAARINLVHEERVNLHLLGQETFPFEDDSFDCVFFCWVLEHVTENKKLLQEALRVLKPNGRIMLTEVNNKSFQLLPQSEEMEAYWQAYNELQSELGGDPIVGIKLANYLQKEGFRFIQTKPIYTHRDQRNVKELHEIIDYWESLIFSGKDQLIAAGKIDQNLVDRLRLKFRDYKHNKDTVFFYTGIQAVAKK